MKKHLLLVTILLCITLLNKAKAQHYNNKYREDTWHVTLGPDFLAIVNPEQPSSYTSTGYVGYKRAGIGAQVRAEYYPNPFVSLSLGTGVDFIPVTSNSDAPNYVVVPFKVGVKAFFAPTWYLGAEAGVGYMAPDYQNSHLTKIVTPAIGYNDNDTGLDISLRYEVDHVKNSYLSFFGLHVAYSFDLTN